MCIFAVSYYDGKMNVKAFVVCSFFARYVTTNCPFLILEVDFSLSISNSMSKRKLEAFEVTWKRELRYTEIRPFFPLLLSSSCTLLWLPDRPRLASPLYTESVKSRH
jgi:hypothetical protein